MKQQKIHVLKQHQLQPSVPHTMMAKPISAHTRSVNLHVMVLTLVNESKSRVAFIKFPLQCSNDQSYKHPVSAKHSLQSPSYLWQYWRVLVCKLNSSKVDRVLFGRRSGSVNSGASIISSSINNSVELQFKLRAEKDAQWKKWVNYVHPGQAGWPSVEDFKFKQRHYCNVPWNVQQKLRTSSKANGLNVA